MQVWIYDKNRVFTGESKFVEKLGENMTTTPLLVGYIKPTLNDNEEWVEGATQQEIDEWNEANKLPIIEEDKITILKEEVKRLTVENDSLKYRIDATENAVMDLMLTGYKA